MRSNKVLKYFVYTVEGNIYEPPNPIIIKTDEFELNKTNEIYELKLRFGGVTFDMNRTQNKMKACN